MSSCHQKLLDRILLLEKICEDSLALSVRIVGAGGGEGPLDEDLINNFALTQLSIHERMESAIKNKDYFIDPTAQP